MQTSFSTKNDVDLIPSQLGPVTRFYPGPLQLDFELDGERMKNVRVQRGFAFRGIDKKIETKNWKSVVPFVDRIDSDAAFFYETLYWETLEDILKLDIPERAQWIRSVICELNRITCHLFTLAQIANSVGAEAGFHYLMRNRENGLDLFELLCGARYHFNYVTLGGVVEDVSDGWLERLDGFGSDILDRLNEIDSLLTQNPVFRDRLIGRGKLSHSQISQHGIRGVVLRGLGVQEDLRINSANSVFEQAPLTPMKGRVNKNHSDTLTRWETLVAEIEQSTVWLKAVAHRLPQSEFVNKKAAGIKTPSAGEAFRRVETPRGVLTSYLVSDGSEFLNRVHFSGPSLFLVSAIPDALDECELRDLPLILCSLGYRVSEADR